MTAVRAELEGGRIRVDAQSFQNELVKSVPGARWNTKAVPNAWSVPLTWAACLQLRGTFGPALDLGPHLKTWGVQYRSGVLTPSMELRTCVESEDGDPALRPFQRPGVDWLALRGHCLLADEVGSGKTVQVASALKRLAPDSFPALIIAPLSTLENWKRELEKWVPDVTVAVAQGNATERRKAIHSGADVVLIGHANVRRHSRLNPYGDVVLTEAERRPGDLQDVAWRTVVVDEAQCMADPHSKITRACWHLLHGATFRYLLTGTPPVEPWCLLHGLDPDAFPVRSTHLARYYEMAWGEWGGLQVLKMLPHREAEYHAIVQPYIRALPKAVTMRYLPPIQGGIGQPMVRKIPLEGKQATAYKAIQKEAMAWLEKGDGTEQLYLATTAAAKITRMRQLLSSYLTVGEDGKAVLAEPSNKLDALEEMLQGELSSEPTVVFAQSRQLIMLASERLKRRKIDHGLIVGQQSIVERQATIDRFQRGELPAVLVTTQAGGAGISLHRSRVAVFLQRTGSITWEVQAEGRVHRDGSQVHESVLIYDLMSETERGCPEERMLRLVLELKAENLESLVRTRALARYILTGERD